MPTREDVPVPITELYACNLSLGSKIFSSAKVKLSPLWFAAKSQPHLHHFPGVVGS